ncbi:MAG: putative hydrolase of the superfamily [Solirubrobacteraceae bacterium]|nr:putative hydrolase of the superfamily [Solirubrobacteraceae bacterium]
MIRAVISDFGGVLTTPLAGSFQGFADRIGLPLEAIGVALSTIAARDGVHPLHELECGRLSEASFLEATTATLSEQLGRDVAVESFAEHYFADLKPNAPMIEFMSALRGEGYRMALLTNNVREWESRWRALAPIEEIFELVVDSAFVGMRKPEPEIYELTLERLGVTAGESLFVDDFEHNCAAASALGMTAVMYREPEQAITEVRAALAGSSART